ncbi:Similar to sbr: Nuclear RNA export factor 1 (Drosophila melanogaster) [Cotesia congregata]|uniref:Similar to sbr: Nuclear RNA export factor 1 (Drosophila melanogaster) n=1 Tax=Cotesia congregata TaxID=51543 RepID=A0A8J2MNH1_COTCN|nr:Similar to sbr: Nuclear RNA export factor 1 (Drosophila melanogaster) [Cotesia congregata]
MPKLPTKSIKSRLGFHSKDEESELDWKSKIQSKFLFNFSKNHNGTSTSNNDDDVDIEEDDNDTSKRKSLSLFTRKNRSKPEPYNISERSKPSVWKRLDYNPTDLNWFQVVLPGVHRFDKNLIINALKDHIKPYTFSPIMYQVSFKKAVFYVDNPEAAENLRKCHKKIIIDNYFTLTVDVCTSRFPASEFDEDFKIKVQQAMSSRYVEETKSLNLSCFHRDSNLIDNYFCALFRPDILIYVLEIASEAVPDLEALNLDNNQLTKLENLTILSTCFKNLKILSLANNKIKHESNLNFLKELNLQDLRLEGNEFISRLQKMKFNYSSVIREKFPSLIRLDGKQLPKKISFDIEDTAISLPSTLKIFTTNQQVLEIAQQFVQLYFNVYDSNSRQPLLDAYLDNAVFTMTISPEVLIDKSSAYALKNRNLLCIENSRRVKLLNKGRLHVVGCLSEFPKTQHLAGSFTLDVKALTGSMMMIITVTGLFKELRSEGDVLRQFCRTFIIEQFGTGYCIGNEQFHLANPTAGQVRLVLQQMHIGNPGYRQIQEDTKMIVKEDNTQLPEGIREQMTRALSERTKMKHEWSYKCLSEVNWIYDVAIKAFEEHHKCGSIPPEAFG